MKFFCSSKPTLTFLLSFILAFKLSAQIPKALEKADWIQASLSQTGVVRPPLRFVKEFLLDKKVKKATLFITSHGVYEGYINGMRIGQDYFTPGYTAYQKRLQYQQYDISNALVKSNRLSITIGDGWWRGFIKYKQNVYGEQLALLCALEITFFDDTKLLLPSDESWHCGTTQICASDMYDGEKINANLVEKVNTSVRIAEISKELLVSTIAKGVKKHEMFSPVKVHGDSILDFGQNIAGWMKLSLHGLKGDSIVMNFSEVLNESGDLHLKPLRTAKATDVFILNGIGKETFEPHFTYHGFRYAKIRWFRNGKRLHNSLANITAQAIALYSDLKPTGIFSCSNKQLNQLHHNILWSMKSNFFDIPTDCPQRSERLGWTQDADVFCSTASYLMDVKNFYGKWLSDLKVEQASAGGVPVVIPYTFGTSAGVAAWSDAATFTPWTLYERYGDQSILTAQYESMKAWVDQVAAITPDYLWKANGYGDWLPAGPSTPLPYLDQCYWFRSTSILIQAARLLKKDADVVKYTALLSKIKQAFEETYLQNIPETQTAYVLGIHFGLLPPDAVEKLVELIHQNKDHLATGFMGTPYLLTVLSENGYSDLAYRILLQQDRPSWLYMVSQGATTMWEKWDGLDESGKLLDDVSFNHYAFGAVGHWMYENIAGIKPLAPGYRSIKIQPIIGGDLTWAKGSYVCKYGRISSAWKLVGKQILLEVEIPSGTSAEVYLPGMAPKSIGPGRYQFTGKR